MITKVIKIYPLDTLNVRMYQSSWQSIEYLSTYFSLDQSGGPTDRLTLLSLKPCYKQGLKKIIMEVQLISIYHTNSRWDGRILKYPH